MEWFYNLFSDISSVAHIVIVFAIVIAAGVMLGKIKVRSDGRIIYSIVNIKG